MLAVSFQERLRSADWLSTSLRRERSNSPAATIKVASENEPQRTLKLRALVPELLEANEPIVKYEFIRLLVSTGFGDYTENGQVIPVSFRGRKHPLQVPERRAADRRWARALGLPEEARAADASGPAPGRHQGLPAGVTSDANAYRSSAALRGSPSPPVTTTARRPLCGSRPTRTDTIGTPTFPASARIVSSISRSTSAGLKILPTAVVGRDGAILTRFGIAAFSGIDRAACSRSSASVTCGAGFQLNIGDRQFAGVRVRASDRRGQGDGRMRLQGVLDQLRIDVVAAADDQLLLAAR